MKTLYFECSMGAAGDMLMAALLELHDHPKDFLKRLNNIGIPKVTVAAKSSIKCGINGTHIKVSVNGSEERSHDHHIHHHEHTHSYDHTNEPHHSHNSFHDIEHLISHLNISNTIKDNVLQVYKLIAEAESIAHGVPVTQVHFHEVGEMDALADITGVCMLIDELLPDKIISSPINVGSGHVRCSHGVLPVPAPATATILKGIPFYSDGTSGELCTPTGAALLKHFVNQYSAMPQMIVSKIGYGMGTKDFEKANCVRAFYSVSSSEINTKENERVAELVCNLDDMTAESISFAQQLLASEGALDVYTSPIGMKKGRSGIKFTCMCKMSDKEKMLSLIFKHTTTLGVREYLCNRYTLQKESSTIQTKFGLIRIKTSDGFGVKKYKPEYDDLAKIACETGLSISEVLDECELSKPF